MWTLATFNVKDLFAPGHVGAGDSAWWQRKLDEVASRIERCGAQVVALQEVGGEAALAGLLQRLGPSWRGEVAQGGERGIACAIVTQHGAARFQAHRPDALPFPSFYVSDPEPFGARLQLRRAVLELQLQLEAGPLSLFCLHLKSHLPMPRKDARGAAEPIEPGVSRARAQVRSVVVRCAEALYVRSLVDAAQDAGRLVAVCGDFNDAPGSLPVQLVTGEGDARALRSVLSSVPAHRHFSGLFAGKPHCFDHMLLSPALHAQVERADFDQQGLRDHGPLRPGAVPSDDSDHALLWASLPGVSWSQSG